MDAWDAIPRGPAIFIATMEGDRPIHGTWVRVDQPEPYFWAELDLLTASDEATQRQREWVVLDQVGIAQRMMPERLSLSGLHHVLAAQRGDSL
jgi:hypothetical protein